MEVETCRDLHHWVIYGRNDSACQIVDMDCQAKWQKRVVYRPICSAGFQQPLVFLEESEVTGASIDLGICAHGGHGLLGIRR